MVNLHAILPRSRANGPGLRLGIWFQGCTLHCPGCCNPQMHVSDPQILMPVADLLGRIRENVSAIEGITLSGGEPLQQPEGLLNLLTSLDPSWHLSVILFSGYTLEEIHALPLGPPILEHVDVLIAGRYNRALHLAQGLRGSANQSIHLLTNRYSLTEIEATPPAEVVIDAHGNISLSGISPAIKPQAY